MSKFSHDFSGIILPPRLEEEIAHSSSQILAYLIGYDKTAKTYVKRPSAPSIIIIPERSGVIAASGITDWLQRHEVTGITLFTPRYCGHELEEVCGSIYMPDPYLPEWTTQEEIDTFVSALKDLIDAGTHPITAEVERLAGLLQEAGEGPHEICLLDDVIAEGGVSDVIIPTVLRVAAALAGSHEHRLRIPSPNAEELVERYHLDEYIHNNQFGPAALSPDLQFYYNSHRSWAIVLHHKHWHTEVIRETFGDELDKKATGFLNEIIRGATDFGDDTWAAAENIAVSRGISAEGFHGATDSHILTGRVPAYLSVAQYLSEHGMTEDEIPSYLLSLSTQLRRRIVNITQREQHRIEKAIREI